MNHPGVYASLTHPIVTLEDKNMIWFLKAENIPNPSLHCQTLLRFSRFLRNSKTHLRGHLSRCTYKVAALRITLTMCPVHLIRIALLVNKILTISSLSPDPESRLAFWPPMVCVSKMHSFFQEATLQSSRYYSRHFPWPFPFWNSRFVTRGRSRRGSSFQFEATGERIHDHRQD